MRLFQFLNGLKFSHLEDFWQLKDHDIPPTPGVYLLVAKPSVYFLYPKGKSAVYYIGCGDSLRRRLLQHLNNHRKVQEDKRGIYSRYEPRHEYGAVYGGRYCFLQTRQGLSSKSLEHKVLTRFAERYHAFPVANGTGAW